MTAATTTTTRPATGIGALRDLRARRKRNRLGELEWFEAAYRVYIAGLFGGGALLWLSDVVGDAPVSAQQAADAVRHGPAALGLVAAVAFCAGLRSGAQGGPLALEAADVVHVMLSPIDRRRALLRPVVQRVRSAAFAGAGLGAVFGQLAGRRLPGSALAWFASGALFGLNTALLWVGAALVAHALRIRLAVATVIAVVGITWQGVALAAHFPGPANLDGSLALWGERQRPADLIAVALTLVLIATGVALLERISLDALARRSSLVAQLRFAVTMQDLRTVVLLRRQLTHERTRRRPWVRLRTRAGYVTPRRTVWRRGWHSLLRLPIGRLLRMTFLAGVIGACEVGAYRGTTPLVVVAGVLAFVLGLEVLEPLSQEIDQPDRTDSLPVERGLLLFRHLQAPLVALVPLACIGAVSAVVVHRLAGGPGNGIAVSATLAVPVALAGAAGAAINIVRDASDPLSGAAQQSFVPPEMAGVSTVLRTLVPLVVSIAGALPVVAVREVVEREGASSAIASAGRGVLAVVLLVAGVAWWVRARDRVRSKFRGFMAQGRAVQRQPTRDTS
jgi:hypothetical protein